MQNWQFFFSRVCKVICIVIMRETEKKTTSHSGQSQRTQRIQWAKQVKTSNQIHEADARREETYAIESRF